MFEDSVDLIKVSYLLNDTRVTSWISFPPEVLDENPSEDYILYLVSKTIPNIDEIELFFENTLSEIEEAKLVRKKVIRNGKLTTTKRLVHKLKPKKGYSRKFVNGTEKYVKRRPQKKRIVSASTKQKISRSLKKRKSLIG